MAEPSRRASRLSIAGAMLAALAIGGAGFVLGRSIAGPKPAAPAAARPAPTPSPAPTPVLPTPQPPLGRAELIAAASAAADALAAGRPLPPDVMELAGRDFELRLPFACPGAAQSPSEPLSAGYDEDANALRVRAEPVRWTSEEWLPAARDDADAAPAAESVEGFWISRPWTSSEACPPSAAPSPGTDVQPVAAEQTLGIAQFFTPDESRVGRRDGKAYQAVESIAAEDLDMSQGLRLRLRGKLARAPGGSLVLCRAPGGTRPVCVVSVALDEVAIEFPSNGATIATWDVSGQSGKPSER